VHPSLAFEWVNYTRIRCPWQYTKKVLIHSGQVLVADRLEFWYNSSHAKAKQTPKPTGRSIGSLA
jgi:predicted hotdog family 3-hydroxylacyl-ACP dehydratase